MNVPELTDASLLDLHPLIRECLAADDGSPKDKKRYGVREYPDWRRQADAFESELTKREISFTKIDWSK